MVLFTILGARKKYKEDNWLLYIPNQLVGVINIDCIITFLIFNNKMYIFYYGIFNFYKSLIFNIFFSQISIQ